MSAYKRIQCTSITDVCEFVPLRMRGNLSNKSQYLRN